jgi:hypothetical protein
MNDHGSTQGRRGIAGSLVLALGLMGAAWILGSSAIRIANSRATITVTGSARQQIRSDLVVWRGMFSAQSPSMQTAYAELSANAAKVKVYLASKGITDAEATIQSIQTRTFYQLGPNGRETSTVTGYRLSQMVEVRSRDVERITSLSRESTDLIQQGVPFESFPPEYLYTKLAELKVEMVARATKDAKARGEEMARNSGSRIGGLRSARMGVFQITPAYSTVVSDYGVNDTSSLMKDITAVVTMSFEIR